MEVLKVIENELVPVYETDKGEKVVYGLELYEVLKVKSNYREWIARRFDDIEAVENKEYQSVEISTPSGQIKKNHIIKLNTAKEMAMLERNEIGKEIRKYFICIEEKYKGEKLQSKIEQSAFMVKFVADDMHMNAASRILMYENMCKDFGIPTNFLPKYEHNGSRQMKSMSALLKENVCELSAVKLNQKLIEAGFLEERERPSSKGGTKKFKALTESGLLYGENAVNPHNQKEVQPLYYADMFMEMYHKVM